MRSVSGFPCSSYLRKIILSASASPLLSSSCQQPLARNVVDLEADAIGILEQDRVVTGRPGTVLGRVDDCGAELDEEFVAGVDVGALAGAEAEVVQADPLLHETLVAITRVG